MRKNRKNDSAENLAPTTPRQCNKLGDGGTYIGGGRLFKKSSTTPLEQPINNESPIDEQTKDIVPAVPFNEQTPKKQADAQDACATFASSDKLKKDDPLVEDTKNKQGDGRDLSENSEGDKKEIIVPYGDYHSHSVFSDGKGTLEENILHAISVGLKEYAITDHAFKHKSSGITLSNFQVQKRMVELYREKYPQIKIYHALEGNLMGYSGLLDTDKYVDELDFLQMGFHKTASNESFSTWWSFTAMNLVFKPSKAKIEKNTLAYLRCIDRYPLKFVNHLNYGILVNCKEIAKLCVERGTKIELNGKRVYFSQQEVDDMLETGVEFVVNSDAHTSEKVGDVTLPVEFAKTHGIPLERIVNLNAPLEI